MNKCVCGEVLAEQTKVCFTCQRRIKPAISLLYSGDHIASRKRSTLQEPISDDRQREIDDEIEKADEIRIQLHPLDPRAFSIIRPAIWLWQ